MFDLYILHLILNDFYIFNFKVVSQDINELELIKQQLENSSPTDNLINGNNQTDSPVQTPTPGDHIV